MGKNLEQLDFDASYPLIVDAYRTSFIYGVEDAQKALHEAVEIKYFYEGSSTLLIGTQTLVVRAGDIVVINPYEFHTTLDYGAEKGKYHLFLVGLDFFSGNGEPDLRRLLLGENRTLQTLHVGAKTEGELLLRVVEEWNAKEDGYRMAIRGLLMTFFTLLLRKGSRAEASASSREHALRYYAVVEPALRRIRDGYAERFTVEELAELCMVSKYHFCRVFKEVTGMTAMQYLNEYRLKIAETMLENTHKSVAEIARVCGFEDESYFCRCFKKHFGDSPRRRGKISGV